MGKTSKWLRSFLSGKKDHKDKEIGIIPAPITPATPKEKRRWSFRRSSATAPANSSPRDSVVEVKLPSQTPPQSPQVVVTVVESDQDEKINTLTVDNATAATANATTATADAVYAQAVVAVEEAAALKIQAYFRSYLARKALRALKGLVKLQALVRGHLVRKQATATLRCMQALITLQTKARQQRIRMIEETKPSNPKSSSHKKSSQETLIHENEENIKIVEMDIQSKQYSNNSSRNYWSKTDQTFSPAASAITEMSPKAYSGHFEDYNSFTTAQSSPQCFRFNTDSLSSSYDYPLFPNYMANTKSSRAKVRSQSAPKQRSTELNEHQSSGRRRSSMEGMKNGVPRVVRMQRSSSQVGSTKENQKQHEHHQYYPWMAIKLDRSNISLKDSECGSTSTVMTNTNYCRSLVSGDVYGNKY